MKPNRGQKMNTKTERNQSLVDDYNAGMSIKDLIEKYKITKARIYQIIAWY